ncbi:MAG TPA: phage portal protein [Candidatus Binataceae bacterium]|nr:phage portal protein [Candidatus Binataceae bacterium]
MSGLRKISSALGSLLGRAVGTRSLAAEAGRIQAASSEMQPLGPGRPIEPREPLGTEPRRWQYPPGINIASAPRSLPGLTTFQQLRNFAATYDVLRICIETRKQQLRGLKWDVVVREPLRTKGSDFSADIERALAFFSHPDGRMSFSSWLNVALEEALVIDALTIYKRRDRLGRLLALELVDGSTIKPLIDDYGRPPAPPWPCYQQFAYGFPWCDFMATEILYRPYNPRSFVNYGFSPVEQTIVSVTIALARQITALNHYKEGNAPAGFGEVPKEWTTAMIREFEEIFNGLLAGDFAARSRIKMVPSGFNFKPWIDSGTTFNTTYDEYLARTVCAAFGLPPTQFIRTYNRATAEAVDDATSVSGFDPLKEFVEHLMDEILIAPDGLNMPHLRFAFISDKPDDEQLELQKNIAYLKAGVLSVDDVLVKLGMEPIGVGRFITVPGQGAIPLDQLFPGEQRLEHETDPALATVALSDAERADLGKWMRKARRALVRRRSASPGLDHASDLSFESAAIAPERRNRLEIALKQITDPDDIGALFASEMEAHPVACVIALRDSLSADAFTTALSHGLNRARREIAELVVLRSGVSKAGFGGARRLAWLHDRAPHPRDLERAAREYFDDDDFLPLYELAEQLADTLATRSSSSAGFPSEPAHPGSPSQSMRPGAHPPLSTPSDDLYAATADRVVNNAARLARARLNRLIDIAHERDFTLIELRDAAARASDFSLGAASSLANQAMSLLDHRMRHHHATA